MPLTLDDSPRSSAEGSPRGLSAAADFPPASVGPRGPTGRRLNYVPSASDTVLAWPAAAEAKARHRPASASAPSRRPQELFDRLKRVASEGASKVSAISERTIARLQERQERAGARAPNGSDLRYAALVRAHPPLSAPAPLLPGRYTAVT